MSELNQDPEEDIIDTPIDDTPNEDIDPDNPTDIPDVGDGEESVEKVIHKIDITGKINYRYMTIPGEYLDVYKTLLYALSKIGKQIMDDCAYSCKQSGHNIFVCWQLFQSAIAAYNIGETKKATLFINYIKAQLPKSIRLEQVELDVIQHEYPNATYYVNDNGSYVFAIQAVYKGKVYQRTITIPMDGYTPPVTNRPVFDTFTWDSIMSYLQDKSYETPFDITKQDLMDSETSVILENGSHTVSGEVIYTFVPNGVNFSVTDLLGNPFEFVEGESKKTDDDGVYYIITDASNVNLNVN